MPSQVTLQDLADSAGVHRSTVSLALRDHPRISLAVRQNVQALAKKMGYRVNPLVAALMQSRRTGRTARHATIAYVTSYPTRFGWRPPHHDRPDYFPGAAARARELGFKLEHFWLNEPSMTPERFCNILVARGIHGMLIGRLPPGQKTLPLLWERFSCVALGMTLQQPTLHRVAEDYYSGARAAMEQLHQSGYRRVGFVFSDADDSPRVGERWLGSFLRSQLNVDEPDRIPPCYFQATDEHANAFQVWFEKYQPDALLVTHAEPVAAWMRQVRFRGRAAVGLVTLVNDRPERGFAGIHSSAEKMGALAAEMLVGLMHRNERGVPDDPHEVLLTGEWCNDNKVGRQT